MFDALQQQPGPKQRVTGAPLCWPLSCPAHTAECPFQQTYLLNASPAVGCVCMSLRKLPAHAFTMSPNANSNSTKLLGSLTCCGVCVHVLAQAAYA